MPVNWIAAPIPTAVKIPIIPPAIPPTAAPETVPTIGNATVPAPPPTIAPVTAPDTAPANSAVPMAIPVSIVRDAAYSCRSYCPSRYKWVSLARPSVIPASVPRDTKPLSALVAMFCGIKLLFSGRTQLKFIHPCWNLYSWLGLSKESQVVDTRILRRIDIDAMLSEVGQASHIATVQSDDTDPAAGWFLGVDTCENDIAFSQTKNSYA
jgi:hypothetical protein